MTIISMLKAGSPALSSWLKDAVKKIHTPRYMLVGDIGHWKELRGQINAETGKINSYRNIRKICEVEGKTIPSLGTLRNYLGEGGVAREAVAKGEWLAWFEDFGTLMEMNKDEVQETTTKEDWEVFKTEYMMFLGY